MTKPRYRAATWSLLATDMKTGESFYSLNADRMSFTGSTRKLFSVGTALNALGADHREVTPVYRTGNLDERGVLNGNLVLVAKGDLTFGGRRINADTIQVTDFDHGDANALRTAQLTPQNPLYALDQLAAHVRAAGITAVPPGSHRRPLLHAVPGTERQPAHHPDARQREPRRRHPHPDRAGSARERRLPA